MTETTPTETNQETSLLICQRTSRQWQEMFEALAYNEAVLNSILPLARSLEALPEGTAGLSRAIQLRKQIREAVLLHC